MLKVQLKRSSLPLPFPLNPAINKVQNSTYCVHYSSRTTTQAYHSILENFCAHLLCLCLCPCVCVRAHADCRAEEEEGGNWEGLG